MFAFFLVACSSAIFGIDMGSAFTKISMALMGKGVHTVLNQQSKRLSATTMVIFNISNPGNTTFPTHWGGKQIKSCGWLFHDQAENHARRFPQNAIRGLNNLLSYENGLTRREALALFLKHMITTVDEGKWKTKDSSIVFAVEPWMKRSERYAIKEAGDIAETNVVAVIDSATAIATMYALEKQYFFTKEPKTVAFIDLGSSHTWVSIFRFSKEDEQQSAEELSVAANMSLGGDLLDKVLQNRLYQIFEEKHGLKPPFPPRVESAFLAEARKVKERLTVNTEADVVMEDVIGSIDFHTMITREEFESLASDVKPSILSLLDEAAEKALLSKNQIDSIELLGGLSRVPFIMDAIKDWAGIAKLNRSMNSDEAISVGAGYWGAAKSRSFIIRKVDINPFSGVNVSVRYDDGTTQSLYSENSRTNDDITLSYSVGDLPKTFRIEIEGDRPLPVYTIEIPDGTDPKETVSVCFGFDDYTIPIIKSAEIKHEKLKIFSTLPEWMESDDSLVASRFFVREFESVRAKRKHLQKMRSEHEALAYKIKNRVQNDEEFIGVITESEREELLKAAEDHIEWASNSSRKTKRSIREHLKSLQALVGDPEFRIAQRKSRPEAFQKLNRTLLQAKRALKYLPKRKPWISKEKLEKLEGIYNHTKKWVKRKYNGMNLEKPTDNPTVTSDEIERKWDTLDSILELTISMHAPMTSPKPDVNKTELNASTEKDDL